METLPTEITNLILDLVGFEDKASLILLSSVSNFYRHLIAPRIFRKLTFKNILRDENIATVSRKVENIIDFARTSEWAKSVESTDFEMRLPDLERVRESGPQGPDHDLEVEEIVDSTSLWFPESLTHLLSNLSSLFPLLSTLEIRFPETIGDCDCGDELLWNVPWDGLDARNRSSPVHVLVKLLDLTFNAVAQNFPKTQFESDSQDSGNQGVSVRQRITHLKISDYPPLGCQELSSPNFRAFASRLISFSLEISQEYELEEGGYFNEQMLDFLDRIIPECFLSHFYGETSLEKLTLIALEGCPFGPQDSPNLKARRMHSLKHLKIKNIVLAKHDNTGVPFALEAFIKANSSTLEVIELDEAACIVEDFARSVTVHWEAFFKFLGEHWPDNLRLLRINENAISRDSDLPHEECPADVEFPYVRTDHGWGYVEWDIDEEDDVPQYRKHDDFKQWVLLRDSILSKIPVGNDGG